MTDDLCQVRDNRPYLVIAALGGSRRRWPRSSWWFSFSSVFFSSLLGFGASLFLLWAARAQMRRITVAPTAICNTASSYGLASRYAHWTTAALMLLLVPMGFFIAVLPGSGARASLLAVHQALGLTVLAIVIVRVAWLLVSPPPAPHDVTVHRTLGPFTRPASPAPCYLAGHGD